MRAALDDQSGEGYRIARWISLLGHMRHASKIERGGVHNADHGTAVS
jgi:hypothetical protein